MRFWVETKGVSRWNYEIAQQLIIYQRSLEEIDEIFEGKKPDHVRLGNDTTLGRIEQDQEKGAKDVGDSVTVLETKDLR